MFTKTKMAVAAALVAVTSTAALASFFDPNLANRYPSYADPIGSAHRSVGTFQSAPVQLYSGRNAAQVSQESFGAVSAHDAIEANRHDRASSPYAGGGF